ncbi:MAG TPA: hypothetical protein VD860_08985, partial [Azospirillum sp.]|nr:hypothetical protein [Azospirillum sp.]
RSYEEAVPHADGTARKARISKAVYSDSAGGFGGIVGVIHDLFDDQPKPRRGCRPSWSRARSASRSRGATTAS